MKIKSFLLTALAASALAVGSASANVIVAYGGTNLGLFTDTGTKIFDYSTTLANSQYVVTDNSGNVYVSSYSTQAVNKYDIASGALLSTVASGYFFTGLAFNPTHSDEIIAMGVGSLGRWNTTSGTLVAENLGVTGGYFGLYYNPTISGGAPEGIYAAHPSAAGGIIQPFDSSTLAWTGVNILIGSPRDITGVGTDMFVARATGQISKYSGGNFTTFTDIRNTLADNYGITNDGTNLWVAQYGGQVAKYNTAGDLLSFFSLTNPTDIA